MTKFSALRAYLSFFIFYLLLLSGCSAPRLYVRSSEVRFNDTEVGNKTEEEIVLKNYGKGKLKINSIDISGEGYSQENPEEPIVLYPNQSYTINLDFAPDELGTSSGFLTINSNNPSDKMMNIKLQGRGVEPKFPVIDVISESIDFQQVNTGSQSEKLLTIRNTGSACLVIRNINLHGEGFSLDQNRDNNINIDPNDSHEVKVIFSPPKQGHFSGILTIGSNDDKNEITTVSLLGEGAVLAPPVIRSSVQILSFPGVEKGKSITRKLTISNSGKGTLTINDIRIKGQAFAIVSNPCLHKTISPYENCSLVISFDPSAEITYRGQVEIFSDDPKRSKKVIQLKGTGISDAPADEVQTNTSSSSTTTTTTTEPVKVNNTPPSSGSINLGSFTHDDVKGTTTIKEGKMEKNSDVSFSFWVQKFGDFEILLTPGYDLKNKDGFKFSKIVTFEDGSKYKRYIRERVTAGSRFNVTINRKERSPDNYKFVFKLFPR